MENNGYYDKSLKFDPPSECKTFYPINEQKNFTTLSATKIPGKAFYCFSILNKLLHMAH